jgi:hypothetical protein
LNGGAETGSCGIFVLEQQISNDCQDYGCLHHGFPLGCTKVFLSPRVYASQEVFSIAQHCQHYKQQGQLAMLSTNPPGSLMLSCTMSISSACGRAHWTSFSVSTLPVSFAGSFGHC